MDDNKRAPLFRKKAIDNKRERLHGDILLVPRLSYTLILSVLLAWLVAVAVWLANSSFSQKETVFGWLDPPSGVVRIFPQQTGGEIDSLLVQEGDVVQEGQELVVVKANRVLASGSSLTSELLKEYELQKETIVRQLKRGSLIASSRERELRARVVSAQAELELIGQQIETIVERDAILNAQAASASRLKQSGYISTVELENFKTEELLIKQDLQELQRARVQQSNLVDRYLSELSMVPNEAGNAKDALTDRLSVISQQVVQLSGAQSYTIVAPRSGVVNNLQVVEGHQIQPDRVVPLMSILPEDSTLTAQLLVPVRSAGFLDEEQIINIRYDAFPYQKFGMYTGTIKTISKTLLLPHEVLNAPIAIEGPVYRVIGLLDKPTVEAYGKTFSLKPGMTLSADIKLGERSLVEWVFEPLFSLQGSI